MSTCGATYFQMVNGTVSPPILDETILRGLCELCESRQIAICSSLFLFRTFLLSLTITIEHCTERCLHEAVGDESWKLTTANLITRRYTEQPKWPLEEFAGRVSIFCARTSFCANLDAQCQHSASFQDTYILCRGSKKFSEENINYNKMLEVHNLIKICICRII